MSGIPRMSGILATAVAVAKLSLSYFPILCGQDSHKGRHCFECLHVITTHPPSPPQPAMDWDASYLAPHHVRAQVGSSNNGTVAGVPAGATGYASSRPASPGPESLRGDSSGTLPSGSLAGSSPGVSIGSKIGRSITQLVRRGSVTSNGHTSSSFNVQQPAGRQQPPWMLGMAPSPPPAFTRESEAPSFVSSFPAAASTGASLDSAGQHRGVRDIQGSSKTWDRLAAETTASDRTCDARRALSLPATLLQGQRDQLEKINSELRGDKGCKTGSPAFLVS